LNEGRLQGVWFLWRTEPFERCDRVVADRTYRRNTGSDWLVAEKRLTGSALCYSTAKPRAVQSKLIA
jgi:hypothetical protein